MSDKYEERIAELMDELETNKLIARGATAIAQEYEQKFYEHQLRCTAANSLTVMAMTQIETTLTLQQRQISSLQKEVHAKNRQLAAAKKGIVRTRSCVGQEELAQALSDLYCEELREQPEKKIKKN